MRRVQFPLAVIIVAAFGVPAFAQPPVAFADAGLHAVQFVDASEGWACGDDGTAIGAALWYWYDQLGNPQVREKKSIRR